MSQSVAKTNCYLRQKTQRQKCLILLIQQTRFSIGFFDTRQKSAPAATGAKLWENLGEARACPIRRTARGSAWNLARMARAALAEAAYGAISRARSPVKPTLALPGFIALLRVSTSSCSVSSWFNRAAMKKRCPWPPSWSCRFVLMLSALFRAAFSIRKFLRNELRRSLSRAARRIGPLVAEGARGHGMDDPLGGMAKAPCLSIN